jgi:tRNA(Ile)-lysidine synthase
MESTRKPESVFTPETLATQLFQHWRIPISATLKVAFSAGMDSHVLLHALTGLRQLYPFSLSALYIDHGLQPQSVAWGEHGAVVCRNLSVPYSVHRVAIAAIPRDGLEAAARRARYGKLAELLNVGEFLLTAHHQGDQAETILLQMLRGAGVPGLAAMPPRAPFGHGELLRPLLGYSRTSLHTYARRHALNWVEDPSNQDLRWRRNYVRKEILPRIEQHWPDAPQVLARTAMHASDALELLDEVAVADLADSRHTTHDRYPQTLSAAAVSRLTPARQRNLLRYWLRIQNYLVPGTHQLDELLRQISTESRSRHARIQWGGGEVWRYRDRLVAVPRLQQPDASLDVPWDMTETLRLPSVGRLHIEPSCGSGVSRQRLSASGLRVRLRQGGEYLRLPGRVHHHALKKLLQNAGVPPWERSRLPLFYANGELVAVADRWVSADYAARPDEPALRIVWEPSFGLENSP